jgi:hypothetical protein
MKINLVGAELFHADGQTDTHEKANSRFSHFCEGDLKSIVSKPGNRENLVRKRDEVPQKRRK